MIASPMYFATEAEARAATPEVDIPWTVVNVMVQPSRRRLLTYQEVLARCIMAASRGSKDDEIRTLAARGLSEAEIAARVDMTQSGVHSAKRRLGLRAGPTTPPDPA